MEEEGACDIAGIPREPIYHGDFSFNTGRKKGFKSIDFVLCVTTLSVSTCFGFYQAWRSKLNMDLNEYLLAGRSMSAMPVGLSLMATFLSGLTMMGVPLEIYKRDTMYMWAGLSALFCMAAAANIYIPVFYQLKLTSAYEYLELRFNRHIRVAASLFFILQMTIYMALVLYSPSVALNSVTGLNLYGSMITIGVICTVYTALGGVKAVIWADSFQMIMMILSLIATLFRSAMKIGSLTDVWKSAYRTNRIRFFDFRMNPTIRHTAWEVVIGGTFTFMSLYSVNQAQVHRCLTCRTLKQAKIAVWLNFPGQVLFISLCCLIGLYIGALYENCDPEKSEIINHPLKIIPLFVMDVLGDTEGFAGFYFAGILCATLSSVSSGLNSISAVIVEDYIRAYSKTQIRRGRLLSQFVAVVFGIISVELAYQVRRLSNYLQGGLSMYGVLAAPVLGVFSLGLFFPCANEKGAAAGLYGSILVMVWLHIRLMPTPSKLLTCVSNCNVSVFTHLPVGSSLNPSMTTTESTNINTATAVTQISYLWHPFLAFLICIGIGLIVSFFTGVRKPGEVDPRLIVPLVDIVFPFYYLPEHMRERFRFGLNHENKFPLSKDKQYANDWGSVELNLANRRPSISTITITPAVAPLEYGETEL